MRKNESDCAGLHLLSSNCYATYGGRIDTVLKQKSAALLLRRHTNSDTLWHTLSLQHILIRLGSQEFHGLFQRRSHMQLSRTCPPLPSPHVQRCQQSTVMATSKGGKAKGDTEGKGSKVLGEIGWVSPDLWFQVRGQRNLSMQGIEG